jgi:hypothetical protein
MTGPRIKSGGDPVIHGGAWEEGVDARIKSGHDD